MASSARLRLVAIAALVLSFSAFLLPATTVSLLWMQGHFHDRAILALPLAIFAMAALQGNRRAMYDAFLCVAGYAQILGILSLDRKTP